VATPGLTGPTSLSSPFTVTPDSSGNLVIPDFGNSRLVKVNISAAVLAFPNTNTGSTSAPLTATVTNIGNEPLTIPALGAGNNPSVSANFVLDSSSTCPAYSGAALPVGAQCLLAVDFAPTTAGALTGSAVLTDNHLNAVNAAQSVTLSGTTIQTLTTPTITWTTPPSITYGTTLGALQLDASSTIPGTFTYSPTAGTVLPVGTTTVSVTFTPTNTTAYTSATATTTITVTDAASAIVVTSASVPGGVILTATVSSSVGTPNGSVQFTMGSTVLGSANLNANGTATLTVTSLPTGNDVITATYSGAADYLSSTGMDSAQAVASGFALSASPATLSVGPVSSSAVTLTVIPTGGFTGKITLSCSGLPATEAGNFSPASVQADGTNSAQTSALSVSPPQTAASLLFPGLIIGGVSRFQRRRRANGRGKGKGLLLLGLLTEFAAMAGCDTGHLQTKTYDVTVTATASGTATGYQGPTTQTVALKVTISR
jgi:Bacterial Ig-like domain (group 3)